MSLPVDATQFDPRSVDELFAAALATTEEDELWPITAALHWRGSREVLDRAIALCRDDSPLKNAVGARVLGQLGVPDRTFPEESREELLALLQRAQDPEVISSALSALSFYRHPQILDHVLAFVEHPDDEVRWALSRTIAGYEEDRAIETLICLSRDIVAEVRDWATFALGTQTDVDTPSLRRALMDRLSDSDADTRAEAIMGLALRHDPQVVAAMTTELSKDDVGTLVVEAAEIAADTRLLPQLLALQTWWDVSPSLLEKAIAACQPTDQKSQ